MIDRETIIEAGQNLMKALTDPETNVLGPRTISFHYVGSKGEDNGDWEIEVRAVRIPEGREAEAPEVSAS